MSTAVAKQRTQHAVLYERLVSGGSVDEKAGIIRGALLCGFVSQNGRRYPRATLEKALKHYEGRPIFCGHDFENKGRSYRDRVGRVKNVRMGPKGLVGDLYLNTGSETARMLLHDAKHDPRSVGLSHTVRGETRRAANDVLEVTLITDVESVDVVLNPATTNGLYEARRRRVTRWRFPQSIDEACRRLFGGGTAPTMDAGDDLGEVPIAEPADKSGDEIEQLAKIRTIVSDGIGNAEDKLTDIRRVLGLKSAPVATAPTTAAGTAPAEESIEDFRRRVNGKPSIQETKAAIRRLIR